MILAMLYSLEHKLHFVLDSSSCNFHENGWNGFLSLSAKMLLIRMSISDLMIGGFLLN